MIKLVFTFAASVLVAFASQADAGPLYLTAFAGGKIVDARDPKTKKVIANKEIKVYSQVQYDKLKDGEKKANSETATMCEATYYLSKKDIEWKKVHEDAKHDIRVRERTSPGKYATICPKDAAAPMPPMKKEEPKKADPAKKGT